MTCVTIGVGQAGCALVDSLFKYKNMKYIAEPIAINSTAKDLLNLKNIKKEDWFGISSTKGFIPGNISGFEQEVVGGFGKNPVKANDVIESYYQTVIDELEKKFKNSTAKPGNTGKTGFKISKKKGNDNTENLNANSALSSYETDIHFAFLFFSLGGGTGCGVAPYIARALKDSGIDVNVIALGVLPPTRRNVVQSSEDHSDRQAWNTNYGIVRTKEFVDAFILVDNQRISFEQNIESMYVHYNDYVASCISDLIAGSFLEQIDPSQYPELNPPVIDMHDILTALSFDHKGKRRTPGFATLGRAAVTTRDLINYIVPVGGNKNVDTLSLAKLAVKKQTMADIDIRDCEKNLALIRAPPQYLRKSNIRINSRAIEEYMVKNSRLKECHMGIALTKRNMVSLTSLFTYKYENIPRLKELQSLAKNYEEKSGDIVSVV